MENSNFLTVAVSCKEEGNELFKRKKLFPALQKYFESLEILKKCNGDGDAQSELNISVNNNISLIYFKQNDYDSCIQFADVVLHDDPNNIKALLRKGQAMLTTVPSNDTKSKTFHHDTTKTQLLSINECFTKAKTLLHSDAERSSYLPLIRRSIQIVNNYINKLDKINKLLSKQKLYSSYFAPRPTKKINLSHLSLFGSNINCVCSMYVIDYIGKKNVDFESMKFRLAPFDIKYKHKTQRLTHLQPKDLVQYDEVTDFNDHNSPIAYFHLGSDVAKVKQLYLNTSNFKWPVQYTFILWIKWEKNMRLITTFDSQSNSPIYVDKNHIGCASEGAKISIINDWNTIMDYTVNTDDDKWSFIAAQGGNDNTDVYIGDLSQVPDYVGHVACDIGNKTTWRIGNCNQGPGKVASILIFDGHLNENELKNVYFQSRNEIFVPCTQKQRNVVTRLLLKSIPTPELVEIILEYVRYNDF
eukprot:179866_1